MRIRTDIRAGDMSLAQCQKERDYWKAQATKMEEIAKSPSPQPPAPTPTPTPSPVTTGSGCGWVNGVYYKDQSGICG
jgi:hypothetical protein